MPKFEFRLWSTRTGEAVYARTQSDALYLFNTQRVQHFDRIDYNARDWQGWRYVDPVELNRHHIEDIYAIDSRNDGLRAAIYICVGIAFAALAFMALFR